MRRKAAPKRVAPSWIRHLHINGTIYYSLDCRDRSWSFRRMITAEDMTDLDSRGIIEDCGLDYHQWLEEADLEDLPDDLELVIFFDSPHTKTPIGTFVSHEKGVKFACCPPEDASAAPSSDDDDPPVVVDVYPKQAFWIASESYPIHYARSHPKQEGAFLTALVHSAHEHISGQGDATGRFNYLEYRRAIDLFLHLKAMSTDIDCMMAANGAITWHIARIMHDIDLHRKERARKSDFQSFSRPSKVLDGLLCCVFFGVHLIYRERLEQVHPARRGSLLVDFRRFIQEVLLEWSDVNLLATIFLAANVTVLSALPGITTFQQTATLASTFFSLLGILIGLYHTWRHRIRTNADLDDLSEYFGGKYKTTESGLTYCTYSNTTLLASMLSVPIASLLWSVLCFVMAVSAYCFQRVNIGSKIMLGLEIGTLVLVSLFALSFFSDKLRECNK
ncbi:hypothetical protein BJY52DRAFT_1236849 [Lactarius psammicola]|nr:hypothetical protein BJY52DRAFT_1236849 [Lactarius psammicola]